MLSENTLFFSCGGAMVQHQELGSSNRAEMRWLLVVAAVLAVAPARSATAQTYTTLYSFLGTPDASIPVVGLARDSKGNLYGTKEWGGAADFGSVFEVLTSGSETVLHSFGTTPGDGYSVQAPVLLDSEGNLYGVALWGGAFGVGVVYEVSNLGVETILYSFTGDGDGFPGGGLIRDGVGNLYGVTGFVEYGPCTQYCGTVFRLAPNGKETVLHSFFGTHGDGFFPQGLATDKKGNLYGFTREGGNLACGGFGYGCGTVFKIDSTGKETILYTFEGGSNGMYPNGAPVLDPSGNIYGTTISGGDLACIQGGGIGCGTVFKVSPAGEETILHAFHGVGNGGSPTDGWYPAGGLVRGSGGNLYGNAASGGQVNGFCPLGCGVIFEISSVGGYTILYSLQEWSTHAPIIRDSSGNFYGTTSAGGSLGFGSVFEVTP
jgi:uncharacterized repeat protein (TIGR03803 family)